MPRHSDRELDLTYDLSYAFMYEGYLNELDINQPEIFATTFECVLPLTSDEFRPGFYVVRHQKIKVTIQLLQVLQEVDDSILAIGERLWSRTIMGLGKRRTMPIVPFRACTDNRGEYPCFSAKIFYPCLVAGWFDPSKRAGYGVDLDPVKMQLHGPPSSHDKEKAIVILNTLFSSDNYPPTVRPIEYDDITTFLLAYFFKAKPFAGWLYRCVWTLASRYAYRDAARHYFTPSSPILQQPKPTTESELYILIKKVLQDVVRHHIEDRRWVQAFWNASRKIKVGDVETKIPAIPKKEINIQQTLEVLLSQVLVHYGIAVVRESNEGVGDLDFRCLYTNPNGQPMSIPIEFKLAHNPEEVERGLRSQLPAYMTATQAQHGLFCVMWFKDPDGSSFDKPEQRKKIEFYHWLREIAKEVSSEEDRQIEVLMIDASIRPSASKL